MRVAAEDLGPMLLLPTSRCHPGPAGSRCIGSAGARQGLQHAGLLRDFRREDLEKDLNLTYVDLDTLFRVHF